MRALVAESGVIGEGTAAVSTVGEVTSSGTNSVVAPEAESGIAPESSAGTSTGLAWALEARRREVRRRKFMVRFCGWLGW